MFFEVRFSKSVSRLRVGFGLAALLFVLTTQAHAQTRPQPPVPLPAPFTPIVDYANVIDAETRQRLEAIYLNMKERGGTVFAVLTVPTTGDTPIFDYSLAVARGWGIGPKDAETPSFLLVAAIQDRKYVTQVSHHLEGDLPDGIAGQIQRERLVPAFRQQNYSKGIFDTVQAYVATIAAKRGFSVEGIDQRFAYRNGNEEQPSFAVREVPRRASLSTVCCGIIVIVFIVLLISGASRGGRGGRGGRRRRGPWGGGGGGLLEALLWGSVLGNLSRGGSGFGSSSGWGGGGGFGGFSGGGGGGGGFGGGFGGGDTFGGGGAGGSW